MTHALANFTDKNIFKCLETRLVFQNANLNCRQKMFHDSYSEILSQSFTVGGLLGTFIADVSEIPLK